MSYPAHLRYSKEHEWIQVDGDIATVGITHHAQEALGDIVHVKLPDVGDTVTCGGTCAEVESVKAVSDVYSPVSGEVVAVNEELDGAEDVVNSDPHGKGWMFKVKLSNPSELDALMDAAAYEAIL